MKYRFKIKSLILFERITGKPFGIETTEDLYVYFWCVRKVNSETDSQSFDDFLNECDENPEMIRDFLTQFTEHNKRQESMSAPATEDKKKTSPF
jgi:hypothetical protein